MKYTYNHPRFSDAVVEQCKKYFKEYSGGFTTKAAIGHVARVMNMEYRDAASCIATRRKPVMEDVQLRLAF